MKQAQTRTLYNTTILDCRAFLRGVRPLWLQLLALLRLQVGGLVFWASLWVPLTAFPGRTHYNGVVRVCRACRVYKPSREKN